eukprot:m.54104 g.54104  ORF g.54104 m.54104 type:complete len:53 (-) comp7700_c0_seq3:107-265(-)
MLGECLDVAIVPWVFGHSGTALNDYFSPIRPISLEEAPTQRDYAQAKTTTPK